MFLAGQRLAERHEQATAFAAGFGLHGIRPLTPALARQVALGQQGCGGRYEVLVFSIHQRRDLAKHGLDPCGHVRQQRAILPHHSPERLVGGAGVHIGEPVLHRLKGEAVQDRRVQRQEFGLVEARRGAADLAEIEFRDQLAQRFARLDIVGCADLGEQAGDRHRLIALRAQFAHRQ